MKATNNFLATFMALACAIAYLALADNAHALQLTNEFWVCNNTNTSGLGTLADPFDGSTAVKFDNIMSNLSENCVMHILAGTYQTAGTQAWNSKSYQKFVGSGMNVTTLHLLSNSPTGTHVICTFNASYSPAQDTNTEVSDLTIDLTGSTNVHGVNLFGYSHVIRRVRVTNITGSPGVECFPIQIASYTAPESSEGNIIEGCEVSNFNGDNISAIGFGGGSASNWMSGVIRNNRVFLSNSETPGGSSVQYAFNVGDIRNLLLEGNYVNNASVAVEIANFSVTNYIIANNTFKNCDGAIDFNDSPLQNITFCFNTVEASDGSHTVLNFNTNTSFTNIIIMGNTFKFNDELGTAETLISSSNITGLIMVNNSIDSRFTYSIAGCTNVNIYNNVDLFGNPYTNLNQVKPPDGIVRTSITGNYAASYADRYIGCKVTPCTITLPPAAGYLGKEYIIADENGSGLTITIMPTPGNLINGLTSLSYHGSYVSRTIISDGSNWYARKR